VKKNFLLKERANSLKAILTPDCIKASCHNCGSCQNKSRYVPAPPFTHEAKKILPLFPSSAKNKSQIAQRLRITYGKKGDLCLISHLDLIKTLFTSLKRTRLPLFFTRGYNPMPKVQYSPPLSLGFSNSGEMVDIFLYKSCSPDDVLEKLQEHSPEGLVFYNIEGIPIREPSLGSLMVAADYRIVIKDIAPSDVLPKITAFLKSTTFPVSIEKKKKIVHRDLKKSLVKLDYKFKNDLQPGIEFFMRISLEEVNYINPCKALSAMLRLKNKDTFFWNVERQKIYLKKHDND